MCDRSRTHHERAIQIGEATVGADHPSMASWHNSLGLVLYRLGDLAGARNQFDRALEILQGTLGRDHPDVASIRRNLDTVVQQLGDS